MINYLIMKIVGKCNLNCRYCYYMNNTVNLYNTNLSFDTIHRVYANLADYAQARHLDSISFCWHGGEPTLVDKGFFREVLADQPRYFGTDIKVKNHIQTNGTLLDDEWAELFKIYNLAVGVSIDGSPTSHDLYRYYYNRRGTYNDVVRSIKMLVHNDVRFGTMTVIDPKLSGQDVFEHHYELGIRRMEFNLPVSSYQNFEQQYGSETMHEFARFMCEVFDAWLAKNDPDVKIQSLESFIHLLVGGKAMHCQSANRCHRYITIEPNGDVGVCENLRVIVQNPSMGGLRTSISEKYLTGTNVNDHSMFEIEAAAQRKFDYFAYDKQNSECAQCSIKGICNFGCLLHRYRFDNDFLNPSFFCEYYKSLINYIAHRVSKESQLPGI